MNKTTQNRLETQYYVTFPDYPSFQALPHHVKVHQANGLNDVIEMSFGPKNDFYYGALKTGSPFKFTWFTHKSKGEFIGYVTEVTTPTHSAMVRYTVVRGVGSGFVLKENSSKIWTNKTSSEIVKDIATQFKLKPCITNSPLRYSQQSLNGKTYWGKVQELAERSGFVAQIHGVTLHYHPIDKMVDEFVSSIPALSFSEPTNSPGTTEQSQTLDQFRPRVGDSIDLGSHMRADKTVTGIDPVTGKLFTTTASPKNIKSTLRSKTSDSLFGRVMPGIVAETRESAINLSEAQARLAQFSVAADGVAQGDPRISPYKTVEINGTGSTTDGFWVVVKATHFMSIDGKYTVDFSCVTDGTGGNKPSVFRPSSAGIVPVRNIQYEMAVARTSKPTSAKLLSQQKMVKQNTGGFKVLGRRWVGR